MPQATYIKIRLLKKHLTIKAAAAILAISPNMLTQLIHGHRPLYAYRVPLAELLEVPVEKIFPDGVRRRSCGARRRRPA